MDVLRSGDPDLWSLRTRFDFNPSRQEFTKRLKSLRAELFPSVQKTNKRVIYVFAVKNRELDLWADARIRHVS